MADAIATPRAPRGWVGDLWGGLAAALVALPSSIAFGVVAYSAISPSLAASGALAGIVGASVLGLFAPLIGRNAGLITAPCAPAAAVLSASAVGFGQLPGADLARVSSLLALTAILAAAFQILYGAVRAGRLIKFIPYQVVTGYLSGVALIIASAQLPKLLGTPAGTHLWAALSGPASWQWPAIVVGAVTIVAMVASPKLTKTIPGAIIGLASGILTYFLLSLLRPDLLELHGNGLIIGPLSASTASATDVVARARSLFAVSVSDIRLVLGSALTLSVLLSIDTLKTGVVLDAMTERRSNSDRELVGQGVANLSSFFLGGMPGAGTTGPTLVNLASGGHSIRSGVFEGAFVLFAFLALGGLVAWVPVSALAGILLVIAFRMFDLKTFVLLKNRETRLDFVVIVAVIGVAEGVGLIEASGVGVLLAILLFMGEQIRGPVLWKKSDLSKMRSSRRRSAEASDLLLKRGSEAVVAHLRGSLFFGTTDQLFTDLEADLTKCRYLLLDLRRVRTMDYTAANLLRQMHVRLSKRGGEVLLAGMPSSAPSGSSIERYLFELGLVGEAGSVRLFDTRDGALEWMEDRILETAGVVEEASKPLELEQIELTARMPAEARQWLRSSLEEVHLPGGQTLFRAGELGTELYLLRRGRIRVSLPIGNGKRHHLATVGPGEFFGEVAFLDGTARTADAEAAVDADLFVLRRSAFDGLSVAHPELAKYLLEPLALGIARRLRQADAELRTVEER